MNKQRMTKRAYESVVEDRRERDKLCMVVLDGVTACIVRSLELKCSDKEQRIY